MFNSIFDTGSYGHHITSAYGNSAPVSKVNKAHAVEEYTKKDYLRRVEKEFVSENTPAYNISISSAGKAALETLQALNKGLKKISDMSDNNTYNKNAVIQPKESFDAVTGQADDKNVSVTDNGAVTVDSFIKDQSEPLSDNVNDVKDTKVVNPNNLVSYSENELRNMVTDGSITRADMYSELERRVVEDSNSSLNTKNPTVSLAIAAYDFQMQYQQNYMLT